MFLRPSSLNHGIGLGVINAELTTTNIVVIEVADSAGSGFGI